jgi:hypothetical protein
VHDRQACLRPHPAACSGKARRARSGDSDQTDGKEAFAHLEAGDFEADAGCRRVAGGCCFVVMAFDNKGGQQGCPALDDLALALACAEHGCRPAADRRSIGLCPIASGSTFRRQYRQV